MAIGLGGLAAAGTGAYIGWDILSRFLQSPEEAQTKEQKKLMGVLSDMATSSDIVHKREGGEGTALELALLQSLMQSEGTPDYGEDEAFVNDQIQTPDAGGVEGILAMALGNQTGGRMDPERVARMTRPEPRQVFDRRLLPFANDPEPF